MNVRFKKEYSDIPNVRLSYELVDDEDYQLAFNDKWQPCYNTKLLGLIPVHKMEPSEDTDTPAIEIFIKLSNL